MCDHQRSHQHKPSCLQDRQRGGVTVAFVALMIPVLLGALILSVDLGYGRVVKVQLQHAADSAAVAGLRAMAETADVDEALVQQTASRIAAGNWANGHPVALIAAPGNAPEQDIVVGRLDDLGKYGSHFTPTTGADANAVKVHARMLRSRGTGVPAFFGTAFGITALDVSAEAVAAVGAVTATELAPMALATPGFAPVNPDEPYKPGPSQPANGTHFEIGETVAMMFFGHGSGPPVHLVLDIERAGYPVKPSDVFKGDERGPVLSLGDQLYVESEGTGGGGFGSAMKKRIDNYPSNHAMREVIVPIVKELYNSRDGDGDLVGKVEIVDFAAVHLDRVRRYKVTLPGGDDDDDDDSDGDSDDGDSDNDSYRGGDDDGDSDGDGDDDDGDSGGGSGSGGETEVEIIEATIIRKMSESRSIVPPSSVMPTPSVYGMRLAY